MSRARQRRTGIKSLIRDSHGFSVLLIARLGFTLGATTPMNRQPDASETLPAALEEVIRSSDLHHSTVSCQISQGWWESLSNHL
jgi:hypothetical protein